MDQLVPMMREYKAGTLLLVSLLLFFLVFPPVAATGTETIISTHENGYQHLAPKISGNLIVWQDSLSPNFDIIHLYNLSSGVETQITDNTSYVRRPVISGNLVTWVDCANDDTCSLATIYLYNITSRTTIPVSGVTSPDPDMPAISGNRIVWQDCSSGTCQIFINGSSPGLESRISGTVSNQVSPSISGNLVAWSDDRNDPGSTFDIYLSNISTSTETRITTDPADQLSPAVYGNRIVWQDSRGANAEIYINGTIPGSEYSLTPASPEPAENPAISGNLVVWDVADGGGFTDIYANDTHTGQKIPISVVPPSSKTVPRVSSSRIVWQDDRRGTDDVYLFTSGTSVTCPVAGFSDDFNGGTAPVTVHFSDHSVPAASHWFWDFGDGSNSTQQSPSHTYLRNLSYDVSLTVGNAACRNITKKSSNIVVGWPVTDFTASPTSDIVPATITFTDLSAGVPTAWLWDFGDGATSTEQNASHTYTAIGTYTVNLTVTNAYGSSFMKRTHYVTILKGANAVANTTIRGLSIMNCAGPQSVSVDTSLLPSALIPNASVLEIQPPADRGFRNLTLYSFGSTNFSEAGTTISGPITGVHLQTRDIVPDGFSPAIGSHIVVNYSVDASSYPCNGTLTTKIWENAIAQDNTSFRTIALGSQFSRYAGTAYTTKIIKKNFPSATARFHMSVGSGWVASVPDGRNQSFIERINDDRTVGEVLPARYESHDPVNNLDYFEADSPHGLSTFGLTQLTGSGNPLQLITLTVASHISPPENPAPANNVGSSSDSGNPAGTGAQSGKGQAPQSPPAVQAPPVDPGKTEKVYTNPQGIITQEMTLKSTDNLAAVSLGQGIVAKDSSGNPLSSITLAAIAPAGIPASPAGTATLVNHMAYEITPSGATFSDPGITLSFAIPLAQWGQEYSVKTYDHASGTWQDLPSTFNPSTGILTAEVFHLCCFAVFAKPIGATSSVTLPGTRVIPVPPQKTPVAPTPSTAITIFMNLMVWVTDLVVRNAYFLTGVIATMCVFYLVMRWKFPGSGT
jgi:beta propeller repeat protein